MARGELSEALAVVEQWLDAVERRDAGRLEALTADDVEVAGPLGTTRRRDVLLPWLARAGFSARTLRCWSGAGGAVVVEQAATWSDRTTGAAQGSADQPAQACARTSSSGPSPASRPVPGRRPAWVCAGRRRSPGPGSAPGAGAHRR